MQNFPKPLQSILFLFALAYATLSLGFDKNLKQTLILFYIICFFSILIFRRDLFKNTLSIFILAAASITVISWLFMKIDHPEIAKSSPNTKPLLDKFIFIPLAIALAGHRKKTAIFLLTATLSALALPWTKGQGWEEFQTILLGKRTGFGGHIITMGVNYGVILIGALIFIPKNLIKIKENIVKTFILAIIALASMVGIIGSQSRSVYLGIIVISIVYIIHKLTKGIKYNIKKTAFQVAIILITISASIFITTKLSPNKNIVNRFNNEISIIDEMRSHDISKISKNSAGLRIHFWNEAVHWITERPITGWGDDASEALHKKAGNYFKKGQEFRSIHNDFLEILLNYGLLALLLFLLLINWIFKETKISIKNNSLPIKYAIFLKYFIIFFIVNGLFMSILFFHETRFSWNIVLASITGYILKNNYGMQPKA